MTCKSVDICNSHSAAKVFKECLRVKSLVKSVAKQYLAK